MGNVPNLEIKYNPIQVMKRRLYLFINTTLILVSLLITSCGGSENVSTSNDQESKSNGTIGVSVLTLGNPFFSVIAENIKSEAAKHGYDVIIVDGDRNVQKQANQIDECAHRLPPPSCFPPDHVPGVSASIACPAAIPRFRGCVSEKTRIS